MSLCSKEICLYVQKNMSLCSKEYVFMFKRICLYVQKNMSLCPKEYVFMSKRNMSLCSKEYVFMSKKNMSLCPKEYVFMSEQFLKFNISFFSKQNGSKAIFALLAHHFGAPSLPLGPPYTPFTAQLRCGYGLTVMQVRPKRSERRPSLLY